MVDEMDGIRINHNGKCGIHAEFRSENAKRRDGISVY
jgi:hypothetical protein